MYDTSYACREELAAHIQNQGSLRMNGASEGHKEKKETSRKEREMKMKNVRDR